MHWIKKGHIFKPDGFYSWNKSHAQVPVAEYLKEYGIIRVYFSTRDVYNRSFPTYVDLEASNPKNVIKINKKPIMELGSKGTFDDCGIMPSWIINYKKKKYLYYIGWNVRNTIPYHNCVGLAISENNGKSYKKFSDGPLWDRDYKDPYYSGTSCVLIDYNKWKNWYLSCTGWHKINNRMEPRYHIKYAESKDGIHWKRDGVVAIDYKNKEEAGIVKASVIIDCGKYKMWYSYRNFKNYRTDKNNSYKIGYAVSNDGINWKRKDHKIKLGLSAHGWDSQMLAYPHVLKVEDKLLMFYNGNEFGKSGFGYAELKNRLN